MTDLDKAREWAGRVYAQEPDTQATCRVIQSLPDQWINADRVREVLDMWAGNPSPTSDEVAVLNDFEALLTPPLPTLAELIEQGGNQEDYAFRWVDTEDGVQLITLTNDECVYTLDSRGYRFGRDFHEVTPLPDLPKLEWPGGGVEDAPVADFEPTLPRPEDAPQLGEAWLVDYGDGQTVALLGKVNPTDDETTWFTDEGAGYSLDWAKPISRLVPEVKP